jgi:hypothetical protein
MRGSTVELLWAWIVSPRSPGETILRHINDPSALLTLDLAQKS